MGAVFGIKGRVSRLQFLMSWLGLFAVLFAQSFWVLEVDDSPLFAPVLIALTLFVIAFATSLIIRRAHDAGLNWIIPSIALIACFFQPWIMALLFVLGVIVPGDSGPNAYGDVPTGLLPEARAKQAPPKKITVPISNETHGVDLPNLVGVIAKFCKVDGVVREPELRVAYEFLANDCALDGSQLSIARELFNQRKDASSSFADYACALQQSHANEPEWLSGVFNTLLQIAQTDGQITPRESQLLYSAVTCFKIEDLVALSAFQSTTGNRHDHSDSNYQNHTDQQEEIKPDPYEVLGVKRGSSPEEIRRAYREKCRQYHPDLVARLGPKLKEVAEEQLKLINEAYSDLTGR